MTKYNLMLDGKKIAELKPGPFIPVKSSLPNTNYTSWFDAIGYPALKKLTELMEVLRQEYTFSLLNPEE